MWVFGVKLSDKDIDEIECLRAVAMPTDFGTKIAITGFVYKIATRLLLWMGFEWSANKMQILLIHCN